MQLALLLLAALAGCGWSRSTHPMDVFPEEIILHAPFSAFINDSDTMTLNIDVIPALAAQAKQNGVNTIWSCGFMSQFDAMTTAERMLFNREWIKAAHDQGMYAIAHVGTTVQKEAVDLAKRAVIDGADAIATVPPYYELPSSISALITWMQPIAAAAPELPLFYYHIPGTTNVNIQVFDLLTEAQTSLPQLLGVKFVSPDTNDWFLTVNAFNNSHALLFAPEPKLQWFGLGFGRGVVLAEDFYAPTYLRMKDDYIRGDFAQAITEQQWKYSVMNVFNNFGGRQGERFAYQYMSSGAMMGPERSPVVAMQPSQFDGMYEQLDALGFFNQTPPATTTTTNNKLNNNNN